MRLWISFGLTCPPLQEQIEEAGFGAQKKLVKQWQKDSEAITRLYINRLLTHAEKQRAQERLFKAICKGIRPEVPEEKP